MSKHTPGPWHIPFYLSGAGGIGPADGYEIITCCCCGGVRGDSKEQIIANSRLIAAAPDLLEACESALTAMKNNDWNEHDSVFIGLRAAIAKAEGA